MKTIIVIKGKERVGKSTIIRETGKKLLKIKGVECRRLEVDSRKLEDIPDEGDYYAEIDCNSKKIGIISWGDPCSQHRIYLQQAVEAGCDIILTASRTKGDTITNIKNVADNPNDPNNPNYEVVWTSHFYRENGEMLPMD